MCLRQLSIFCGVMLLGMQTVNARSADLDSWVDAELIPAVNGKLLSHPRFKGETVMFVVLQNNTPSPVSNELALSLRDRLLDAALDTDGVRIGWRQSDAGLLRASTVDCTRDDVDYYIGIELSQQLDRRYEIKVRAMDLQDRSWIGGFGSSWRGNLTSMQQRALNNVQVDKTFLGGRDVPFALEQTDLLARHLAHELSCELHGQTSGQYIVPVPNESETSGDDLIDGTLELISKNIAAHSAIALTSDSTNSNALLSAEAYVINNALHQYWLTITPNDTDSELGALSVSAYVLIPNSGLAAAPRNETTRPPVSASTVMSVGHAATLSIPNAAGEPLLGPLRVVAAKYERQCRGAQPLYRTSSQWSHQRQCSLLEAKSHADAVVFVIEHQPQMGLVRVGGETCRARTTARIVRGGEPLQFPIARFETSSGQARPTDQWLIAPSVDTFYAIAISNATAARQFANHIDKLPQRCGTSSRPGLTGHALRRWMDDFASLAARTADNIDWRALELKSVY